MLQNTKGLNQEECHCAPQLHKCLQMVEACEDCGMDVGVISDVSVGNTMFNDMEV